MNRVITALAVSLVLIVVSCNKHPRNDKTADLTVKLEESPAADTIGIATGSANIQKEKENKNPDQTDPGEWDKKIVKTATLNIEVDQYKQYDELVRQLVKKWEGYIGQEEENASDYKKENSLTIKVPVQWFDAAMNDLTGKQGKLLEKQVRSEDVTADYMDGRARMEARKKIRLRYLDLLQKAKTMEDMVAVEREISSIQEQIEAAEGRVNYLQHAAAYSTIQLTFFQVIDANAHGQKEPGFGKRILLALSNGTKVLTEIIILLITIWPLWMLVIGIMGTVRVVRTARKK